VVNRTGSSLSRVGDRDSRAARIVAICPMLDQPVRKKESPCKVIVFPRAVPLHESRHRGKIMFQPGLYRCRKPELIFSPEYFFREQVSHSESKKPFAPSRLQNAIIINNFETKYCPEACVIQQRSV
jgi:hypothetical protein